MEYLDFQIIGEPARQQPWEPGWINREKSEAYTMTVH
jgi:hypothetical protein